MQALQGAHGHPWQSGSTDLARLGCVVRDRASTWRGACEPVNLWYGISNKPDSTTQQKCKKGKVTTCFKSSELYAGERGIIPNRGEIADFPHSHTTGRPHNLHERAHHYITRSPPCQAAQGHGIQAHPRRRWCGWRSVLRSACQTQLGECTDCRFGTWTVCLVCQLRPSRECPERGAPSHRPSSIQSCVSC